MNKFLAGVSKALIFQGDNLIGVGRTFTESTLNYSIDTEEIRGGESNGLLGKYFHDSNLGVTITDAMFKLEYIAATLGVDINQGGLSINEEQVTAAAGGILTATQTPIAVSGSILGWYKRPADENWNVATFQGSALTVAGASAGDVYCIKYFYQNENARSIIIPVNAVPAELHIVLINDLFNGDISTNLNSTETARVGRLITDIPRFQSDGSQELTLNSTSAATVSLSGNALAIGSTNNCEDDLYYGTMTEEIFGQTWQSNAIAIAVENSDIELAPNGSETLNVRVLFAGNTAAQRKANNNFTFTVDSGDAVTVTADGVVTAGETAGSALIQVALTGAANVDPAFVKVTVSAD